MRNRSAANSKCIVIVCLAPYTKQRIWCKRHISRAWRGFDSFKNVEGGSFRAWLYRIATNACLNSLASRKDSQRFLPDQLGRCDSADAVEPGDRRGVARTVPECLPGRDRGRGDEPRSTVCRSRDRATGFRRCHSVVAGASARRAVAVRRARLGRRRSRDPARKLDGLDQQCFAAGAGNSCQTLSRRVARRPRLCQIRSSKSFSIAIWTLGSGTM